MDSGTINNVTRERGGYCGVDECGFDVFERGKKI